MKPWMRYSVAAAFTLWLVGNIPAWLLLGTYTEAGRQHSYAFYWSAAPLFAFTIGSLAVLVVLGLREGVRWMTGGDRETQAERIERMERELGIGKP